jgi:3-oxoacyl-[acyl-carrier protein] reductase
MKYQGQIALVTGASRGIGAAIALELANHGVKVIGTATTPDGAHKIREALSPFEGCDGHVLDVTQSSAADALIDTILKTHGNLHILVNNDWDCVIETNLKGVFRMSRSVLRSMMKQRYGRIINITSVVGASGNAGQVNYAASKAGVVGMTRALAKELGSRNITVNCIAPGFIETDMTASLSEEQQKALLNQIPIGHLGKPSDIAHAVAYLASPQAAYVTGQELHVNGGMYM